MNRLSLTRVFFVLNPDWEEGNVLIGAEVDRELYWRGDSRYAEVLERVGGAWARDGVCDVVWNESEHVKQGMKRQVMVGEGVVCEVCKRDIGTRNLNEIGGVFIQHGSSLGEAILC